MRVRLVALPLLVIVSLFGGRPLLAADQSVPENLDRALRSVLRTWKATEVNRRDELEGMRKTPLAAAQWQSGYVRANDAWQPFESVKLSDETRQVRDEYFRLREEMEPTAEGHLRLAKWCRGKDLPSQDYAHSMAAVLLAPDQAGNAELLARLGFRQVGGEWILPEDIAAWQSQMRLAKTSLAVWGEKLSLVAAQLGGTGRRRQGAMRVLDQLHDAQAVPAIEWRLCGGEEPVALVAIERLKHIGAFEATQALARQAVFNRWPKGRTAAQEALLERKFEDFVPDLISLLAMPAELIGLSTTFEWSSVSTYRIVQSRGTLLFNFIVARETDNQFQVAIFSALDRDIRVDTVQQGSITSTTYDDWQGFQLRLLDETYRQQTLVDRFNDRTAELNACVTTVLKAVSRETEREKPRDWWDWWNDYNDYDKRKPKRVRKVVKKGGGKIILNHTEYRSCLAAGTQVWTDEGPLAVETLKVGDQVLSQDVESGELGYLPVLHTTARSPTAVFRLTFGSESLVSSGAHRFWVSGQGWHRVHDLEPGDLLHTATGAVALTSREPAPDAAVYNLVLSPTHNYFVGQHAVLTHDVTLPRSTNRKVPGLAE